MPKKKLETEMELPEGMALFQSLDFPALSIVWSPDGNTLMQIALINPKTGIGSLSSSAFHPLTPSPP